ncbi:MAG: MbnH family di-heme enzyme [Myxococcota bacterium]|nr:MbnH family di-heme enzyme [Myxococcota bacterium]
MRARWILLLALAFATNVGCSEPDGQDNADTGPQPYKWELPEGVPEPAVPEDNPVTLEKAELGRHLFYDKRLSGNETQACAGCHKQELAFTDGLAEALGSTGQAHFRSSMGLTNIAYSSTLGWAGPATPTLERQAPIPMFGDDPVELGLSVLSEEEILERFRGDALYEELFARAYPDQEEPITLDNLIAAIATFERTLVSFNSPFDRYIFDEEATALTESERRGMDLFFSERLECFHCHGGFNLSDSITHEGLVFESQAFHNTGLYNIDFEGGYPERDRGLYDITGVAEDMGKFKAPTLRNIAVTAPFFHDGSAETLDDVLDHYERGGRAITSGEYVGDGAQNPYKSELITGFLLSDQEREDLKAFLNALTDQSFLEDPRFSDPFEE